jgi:hypothetical protein
MSIDRRPFADVVMTEDGFTLPELKWRELLFIGVLRAEGAVYVRDDTRPVPPFERPNLFPGGARFEVSKAGGRIHLKRV